MLNIWMHILIRKAVQYAAVKAGTEVDEFCPSFTVNLSHHGTKSLFGAQSDRGLHWKMNFLQRMR